MCREAVAPTAKSLLWLLKIMVPTTLLVTLLDHFGIVALISQYTTPLFNLMGLGGDAAFVFITSCLTNIYSAIGVMAIFDMDLRSVTIMASMCLISHNLIVEGVIQSKSGSSLLRITILRIASALICGFILNQVLPDQMSGNLILEGSTTHASSLTELLTSWALSTLRLSIKIAVFILLLNILQNLLKVFKVIPILVKLLKPIMRTLGLPQSTTMLWIVANTLGLAYGGAAIIEEIDRGEVSPEDAKLLNTSVAITHSLLEDTILFCAIGVPLFWVATPRIILSIVAVWGIRLLFRRLGTLGADSVGRG